MCYYGRIARQHASFYTKAFFSHQDIILWRPLYFYSGLQSANRRLYLLYVTSSNDVCVLKTLLQWRYVLFAALFAAELALILSPSLSPSSFNSLTTSNQTITSPTILHILFPQRTTYQHIQFLHQLFMFLSVALSRVAPHFFPISTEDPRVEAILLEKSMGLAAVADREGKPFQLNYPTLIDFVRSFFNAAH